jgi:hypothetical protein
MAIKVLLVKLLKDSVEGVPPQSALRQLAGFVAILSTPR